MSLNETPKGERLHIGIFGRRNAGKSSLLNAITNQDIAVVSHIKGTTTDPVSKAMEIPPIGPVLLVDTPGTDDYGELGKLRISKTCEALRKTDIALLVVSAQEGLADEDRKMIHVFNETGVKYLIVYNKADLCLSKPEGFCTSCLTGENIELLKEKIAELGKLKDNPSHLVADIINAGDIIVLVVPIDEAAPKGRLILPQQQVIRDILDTGAIAVVTRDGEFAETLDKLKSPPRLVITDSQVFAKISKQTPAGVSLTSFSILMAKYKGILESAIRGAKTISALKDGDKVLIAEGCSHHRQCEDIGTVKLPRMIEKYTGVKPVYEFSSGGGFPHELSDFALIIHCGGCMQNAREMSCRTNLAQHAGVPMTNYGVAMSYMQGILERCVRF